MTKAACGLAIVVTIMLALPRMVVITNAAAAENPAGTPVPDAGVATASESGRPICIRVGTRSEGWAWPSGRFIHWAKCKGVVPKCKAAGAGREVEGWYAGATLIAPARCAEGVRKHR